MQWRRFLPTRNPAPLMVALIVSWGLFSIACGERLPRKGGFGWDGTIYRNIIQHLGEHNEEVTMYHGMRCLPCVVIHYTLKALGLPLDDPHIFQAFRLYNLFWFVVILLTLLAIVEELGIGLQGKWLVIIALCCSYFHLKQYYYSPILPDLWGMAFCVLALRCYFKQQRLGVAGWTFLGAFTWSIVPYYGALLILFPYRGSNPRSSSPALAGGTEWPARILAALAAGLIAAFAAYVVWVEQFFGSPPAQISHRALPVSIVCLALFLYLALKEFPLVGLLPRWRDVTSLDLLGRVGLLAVLFGLLWVAHRLLQPFFSTRPIAPQHSLLVVRSICAYSVAKPLVFLLTQVLYYGPAVILIGVVLAADGPPGPSSGHGARPGVGAGPVAGPLFRAALLDGLFPHLRGPLGQGARRASAGVRPTGDDCGPWAFSVQGLVAPQLGSLAAGRAVPLRGHFSLSHAGFLHELRDVDDDLDLRHPGRRRDGRNPCLVADVHENTTPGIQQFAAQLLPLA